MMTQNATDRTSPLSSTAEKSEAPGFGSNQLGSLSPPFLLVAEDNSTVRDYYSEILTKAGYHFDLVENGEVAWEKMGHRNYSLIITDHDMPRLTGLALIKRLDEKDYRVPVFLVSGTLPQDDARAVGHCLLCMISKPVTSVSFLARIQEALSLDLPVWFTHPMRAKAPTAEAEDIP